MLVKGPLSPAISTLQLCRMHHFVTRYLLGIWLLAGLGPRCTRCLVPRPTPLPARAVLQLLLCCQSREFGVSLWEREPPLSSPARGVPGAAFPGFVCRAPKLRVASSPRCQAAGGGGGGVMREK